MPYKDKNKQKQYKSIYDATHPEVHIRFNSDEFEAIKHIMKLQNSDVKASFVKKHFFASLKQSLYIPNNLAHEMKSFNKTVGAIANNLKKIAHESHKIQQQILFDKIIEQLNQLYPIVQTVLKHKINNDNALQCNHSKSNGHQTP